MIKKEICKYRLKWGILLKKSDFLISVFLKIIILMIFLLFCYYKMKLNLFIIVITLLFFSLLNSFFILDGKIKFDMELFSFQAITCIFFERTAIFNWREVSEKIFSNYNYVILIFMLISLVLFLFLKFKSENIFLRKYFYCIFLYLVVIQNILESEYLEIISIMVSVYEVVFSHYMIDIFIISVINIILIKKDKKFIYNYFFIFLAVLIRYMTNVLWRV